MRVLAGAALLLLLAASPVQALVLTTVSPPASPLVPDQEVGLVKAEVSLACRDEVGLDGTTLDARTRAPGHVVVTGLGQVHVPPCGASDFATNARTTVAFVFQVAMTRDSPGLQPVRADLQVHRSYSEFDGGPWQQESEAEAPFALAAAPYFLSEVQAQEKHLACSCEAVTFHLRLQNLGNVATQYGFVLEDATAASGWQALLPPDLVLGSPLTGGQANGTVALHVAMPSEGQAVYRLRVEPRAAADPSFQGDPLTLDLLAVRTAGGPAATEHAGAAAELPGVGPMLAVGLVALAAVARRRA